jgi:iron-sulfur cluster repair protein YtfE (RIC family)
MDEIDEVIQEHAELRRLAGEIEKTIGPQRGVGWDDRVFADLPALRAAQGRFQAALQAHEAKEDRVIHAGLRRRAAEREELETQVEKAHRTLDSMSELLHTLFSLCDGTHVHAIRCVSERLRQELEAHLEYEEKVLFPLLRAAGAGSGRAG